MALTEEGNSNGFFMPVAPAYGGGYGNNGGFGFGGDWGWIILLLLCANGGWGMGGFGGGNMMLGYDFPWLLNGQNNLSAQMSGGFRDAMLNDGINGIRDGINGLSMQLCNNEMAALNRSFDAQTATTQGFFGLQSQLAQCCCDNRLATEQLRYTVASENCADREALNYGIRDILTAQTAGTQRILDKLCDQELQAERRENEQLRSQLQFANMQASQVAQTAELRTAAQTANANLLSELRSCPIPTYSVYGNVPVYTCGGSTCGCGNNFAN